MLNVHGLTATGKSSILRSFFHLSRLCHAIINVRECITTRHLVERIVASTLDALDEFHDEKTDRRAYARTENLSALCVNTGKLLEGRGKFVLVLDAMDKLREGGGTLIAALGRLGESVCPWLYQSERCSTKNPQRYLISPSSSQQPYHLRLPSSTLPRPCSSISQPTHGPTLSPF